MNAGIAAIGLVSGPVPIAVDVVGIALLALAVFALIRSGARPVRRAAAVVGALAVGAAVGLALCWLLSDQLDLFEVSLSPVTRAWVAIAFAGAAVGLLALVLARGAWRAAAAGAVVTALLAGGLGVNADFGQYTTVGSLVDSAVAQPLPAAVLAEQRAGAPGVGSASASATSLWRRPAPAGMPRSLTAAIDGGQGANTY